MTYHGGVEDGISVACARILRIILDRTLPDEYKLDEIEQYCRNVVKEPVRERLLYQDLSGGAQNTGH